jgi:hypothetical protein
MFTEIKFNVYMRFWVLRFGCDDDVGVFLAGQTADKVTNHVLNLAVQRILLGDLGIAVICRLLLHFHS